MLLRAPEPSDIDFLYRIENIPEIWRVSLGDSLVSRQMLWDYINSYSADIYADRQMRLIIEVDGNPVGTIDLTDLDPRNSRAMVGIAIDPDFRGRGYGKEALQRLINRCRDTWGLHQLCALVPRTNELSLHLFDQAGFQTSGCLRSWLRKGKGFVDVIALQLFL